MPHTILCGFLLLSLGQTGGKTYPRAELLIEASELAKPEVAGKYRILDTRSAKEWQAGHVPGSVAIPISEWSKQFAAGPNATYWQKELGRLGIDADIPVVVYGEDTRETARAWWILRYWGTKNVRFVNGGWTAWEAGKFPQEKGTTAKATFGPTSPKLVPAEQRLATKDQIKESLKDKLFQIVDARSEAEYCGDVKTMVKRAGSMPGAINLEWKEVVNPKTQKFKTAAELEQLFKKAGIDLTKPSVAHCQSGGRSSVMVFAMELMGAADVRNYYRSWAEWGNADDTPIVVPSKK